VQARLYRVYDLQDDIFFAKTVHLVDVLIDAVRSNYLLI